MSEVPAGLFTVGVFQDVAWASKGLDALKHAGFAPQALTILAKDSPDAAALIEKTLGSPVERIDVANVGPTVVRGALFETLAARGGILVAIRGEPRAADALAILHSYGGGNAAIGAWSGRV
jgi:hypothetical protein